MPLIPSPYLFWPTFVRDDGRPSLCGRFGGLLNGQQQLGSSGQRRGNGDSFNDLLTSMEMSPEEPSSTSPSAEDAVGSSAITEMETVPSSSTMASEETSHGMPSSMSHEGRSSDSAWRPNVVNSVPSPALQADIMAMPAPVSQLRSRTEDAAASLSNPYAASADLQTLLRNVEGGELHQFIPISDPARWELPFLQGWLMGQTHAGLHTMLPVNGNHQGNSSVGQGTSTDILMSHLPYARNVDAFLPSSNVTSTFSQSRASGRSVSRHRSRARMTTSTGSGEAAPPVNAQNDENEPHPGPTRTESEISTSLAALTAAELPCTVKLRIWPHDIRVPCAALDTDKCRLTIPHAVLCRYVCFEIKEPHVFKFNFVFLHVSFRCSLLFVIIKRYVGTLFYVSVNKLLTCLQFFGINT